MLNEKDYFWKNFRLGAELQNSGTFIYNGILSLDKIEYFRFEEECFEFLYNISIGIERLEKILIILIEHDNSLLQEDFEQSLITHNHLKLLNRIKSKREVNFGKAHFKFLGLLADFYKSTRYERFNISSIFRPPQEKEKLVEFIQHELKLELTGYPEGVLENSDRVKKFLGKLVKKVSITFYDLIRLESRRNGTFTHEIRYNSKAYKIFMEQEFDFRNEKLMQREVFLHLIKNFPDDELKKFIDTLKPLPFESYQTNHYIQSMLDIHKNTDVKDEMLYLYDEERPSEDRISEVLAIGSDINFDSLGEIDEEEF